MIKRAPTHCGDDTCAACVVVGLSDMVQINLYLKNLDDFDKAREVFREFFPKDRAPARMTTTTEFLDAERLCMIDGVAYKPVIEWRNRRTADEYQI